MSHLGMKESGGDGSLNMEVEYIASEGQSDTTSDEWQDKINHTTSILSAGTYVFNINVELSAYISIHDIEMRLLIDDVEYISNSHDKDSWELRGGFVHLDFSTETTHTLKLQWRSELTNFTKSIRRARISLWRVK